MEASAQGAKEAARMKVKVDDDKLEVLRDVIDEAVVAWSGEIPHV